MKVHSTLGNGFPEIIYHRAMTKELELSDLKFLSEHEIPIYYDNTIVGTRRVDFFVEERIPVEIKAVGILEAPHFSQAMNYLEAFNLPIGLLLNFGSPSLQYHRITNKKLLPRT